MITPKDIKTRYGEAGYDNLANVMEAEVIFRVQRTISPDLAESFLERPDHYRMAQEEVLHAFYKKGYGNVFKAAIHLRRIINNIDTMPMQEHQKFYLRSEVLKRFCDGLSFEAWLQADGNAKPESMYDDLIEEAQRKLPIEQKRLNGGLDE